jgi:formylglycine-generating enzyme
MRSASPPALLYLPDGGDVALSGQESPLLRGLPEPARPSAACAADMVSVGGAFCIDRYEMSLVETRLGRPLSPYYHPVKSEVARAHAEWQARAEPGQKYAVPEPPGWELSERFDVRAVSAAGRIPNGYLSARIAERACQNAGKRLCSAEEWRRACRGEADTKYPYGAAYRAKSCNVFRATHPGSVLHGNASIHHLDPRLNLVEEDGDPLLWPNGSLAECKSQWGTDAAYDMVGNLDEWVSDPDGAFLGGFYARDTQEGCEAAVHAHPPEYFDYSLGARCCRDPGLR